ncbi:MAG: hypothetical protein ACYDG2_22130 [Ruminiclostridium sp.]
MSLSIIVANNEVLYQSCDSRMCVSENEKYYATNDDVRKIQIIHNKIIFGSGNCLLIHTIWEDFKNQPDGSLEKLQQIAQIRSKEFTDSLGEEKLKEIYTTYCGIQFLGLTISEWADNKPKISYMLNNEGNFKITSTTPKEGYAKAIASGCKTEEVQKYINKAFYEYRNINKFYTDIYSKYADEQIGGTLRIYKIENGEITFFAKEKIIDSKEILRR